MTRPVAALLAVCLLLGGVIAQPAADPVKDALAKYKAERAEATKTFTKEELGAADELAAKAEAATDATKGLRLATEARWAIPLMPTDLPKHVIRVLGATRLRHGDRVNAIAYSPDGTRLVSSSRDGTVRVWDLGNGRELLAYRGHEGTKFTEDDAKPEVRANVLRVPGVAFSPDGKLVASCGATEIHVWEADTGKRVKLLKGHKKDVKSLTFGKTADVLVSGGDDKVMIVWDVPAEKPQWTSSEMTLPINAVAASPDFKAFGCIDASGQLTVFSFAKEPQLLCGVNVSATGSRAGLAVAFARDGQGVFTGGSDDKVTLTAAMDATGGRGSGVTVKRFEGHSRSVNGVAVSKDGKFVVSAAGTPPSSGQTRAISEEPVIVWEIETGKQLRALPGHTSAVMCVAVRPDGKQIAAGGDDGTIRVWPLTEADEHRVGGEAKDNLWAVAVSPNGKTYATGGADKTVRVYDTATGALKKELVGHTKAVTAAAFVTDTTLATVGGDKVVKLWDLNAGSSKDLGGHTSAVLAVAVADKLLVTGSADREVRGWDATDGKLLWTWASKSAVCSVAVRPDGKRAAVGCADGTLAMLNVEGKEPVALGDVLAHQSGVSCIAYAPAGYTLVTCGGDGLAVTWTVADAGSPTKLQSFAPPGFAGSGAKKGGTPPPQPLSAVAFSADGKFVVAGGAEGAVRIWDANTAAEVRSLRGHLGWVTAAAFTPDGRNVVSAGIDQKVRLFELPRSDAAAGGHLGAAKCIAVSRDGKFAATGGSDSTVKVWDLATGREVCTLVAAAAETIISVTFRGNDRVVAGCSRAKLFTWAYQPAKLLSEVKDLQSYFYLAASEDGSSLAAVWAKSPTEAAGFDLITTAAPTTAVKLDAVSSGAVSPDAAWGLSGKADGTLIIWDLAKKQKIGGDWPITKNAIVDIGVTPDKKTIVVIDDEGDLKIADAAKREVKATVKAIPNRQVTAVVVSPTGDTVATLGGDGEIKVWDLSGKELRAWKLPFAASGATFTIDGKRLLTANADGSAFVLEMP